jgi:NAD+ diphosphatase
MVLMRKSLYYIFHEGKLLLRHAGEHYTIYTGDVSALPVHVNRLHLFESDAEISCFTGSSADESLPEGFEWVDLRASFHLLPHATYQQAGKASELLYFDTHHQYCSCCGGTMQWNTPISKCCQQCEREIWPQLNTAIIVLVHRGDEALLVKAKNFKRNYHGLVAGFVETGESLEECVCREVREETGLAITNIRYFGSQPWPYPMGLMIGFHADYVSGEIALVDGELSEAAFFSRDNLPAIPDKMSMARMLIDDWLMKKA